VSDPRDMANVYDETIVVTWDPDDPQAVQNPAEVARARGMHAAVLTAWNPGELRRTDAENDAANARMRPLLEATGCVVWLADGRNPDGTFHEPGFCVWGIPVERALEIARQFDQYAIYLYRTDGVREIVWTDH